MKKDLTIYDVQVNCARLSKEKIENLARIVEERGGKIWGNSVAFKKINNQVFFNYHNGDFALFSRSNDFQSVSYARFVELFDKKELEVGKWYKSSVNGNDFVKFIFSGNYGNHTQTGFDADNEWFDMGLGLYKEFKCIPMTEQEISTLLIAEAKKRFGEDWENAKIKVCVGGFDGLLNNGRFDVFYDIYADRLWNKNGLIYEKGKWAELLVDPKQEAIKSMKPNVDIITIENPSQETKDMCMKLRKDKEEQKEAIRKFLNATPKEMEATIKSVEAIEQMKTEIEKTMQALSKPTHYKTKSGYDVIDIWHEFDVKANLGAVCKYTLRAGKKLYPNMNELESYLADLKKAQDHLNREIEFVKSKLK